MKNKFKYYPNWDALSNPYESIWFVIVLDEIKFYLYFSKDKIKIIPVVLSFDALIFQLLIKIDELISLAFKSKIWKLAYHHLVNGSQN